MKTVPILALLLLCSCAHRVHVGVSGISLYATGEDSVGYSIERHKGGLTNWVKVGNFIGEGTNSPPELIVTVPRGKSGFYRIRPE